MAHYSATLVGRKWDELSGGELILFRARLATLAALVLKKSNDESEGRILLLGEMNGDGVIKVVDRSFRTAGAPGDRMQLLSFDQSWEIRPRISTVSLTFNNNDVGILGALCISSDSAFLSVESPGSFGGEPIWFDLETAELCDPQYGPSVPILGWELWAPATGTDTPLMAFQGARE